MTSPNRLYPVPEGVEPSSDYKVRIDGSDAFVFPTPVASIASFCCGGRAEISIEILRPFSRVRVRPMRWAITPRIDGRRVSFTIEGPGYFSVEIDDDLLHPLYLFASPPETGRPSPDDPGVRHFAAGKVHTPGLIHLHSGEQVYIEGGAVVRGAITAVDATGIKVWGRGFLDGSNWPNDPKRGTNRQLMVQPTGCNDVVVEGITVVHAPCWGVVPIDCTDVLIQDVQVVSSGVTGDGIDIVGSENVEVANCFVRADDDCIALKATGYYSPRGEKNVRNVNVHDCVIWNGRPGNALEIGFETRCDSISDVRFTRCDIIHSEFEGYESGAIFSIHNGDRGVVSNVALEDIRIEDAREKLVDLKVLHSRYSRDVEKGQIRNILFKDIQVVDGLFPVSIIRGFDRDHMIDGIAFENLVVHGKKVSSANEARMVVELSKNVTFA